MSINFKHSGENTVGIEVEVQLLDKNSLGLTNTSTKIIDGLEGYSESIKHELMMSNLEVNTKICLDIDEAAKDLYEKFNIVIDEALNHDTVICCAGTHPFSHWKDQIITKDERYQRLLNDLCMIARRFNVFGLHVHVGVSSGEKCIYIMNRLLYYIPHLLALSVNSPFWNGEITGLSSYRTKVFESLPTAGLPFYFNDWADYSALVDNFIATGTIETIRDIWWDLRPHNNFGTIEIRVCDSPSSLKEILAIASLIQALVNKLGNEFDEGAVSKSSHPSVVRENKWRASRFGLNGDFITEEGNKTINAKKAIYELVESVEANAKQLGSLKYLSYIDDILKKGDGAARQMDELKKRGDITEVVTYLSKEFTSDVKSGILGNHMTP